MTKLECLASDYWIENSKKIYQENLHISSPIMDAYKAGFGAAKEMAVQLLLAHTYIAIRDIPKLGDDKV